MKQLPYIFSNKSNMQKNMFIYKCMCVYMGTSIDLYINVKLSRYMFIY